jgi:monoterpene epsilon-lactone hydrolase
VASPQAEAAKEQMRQRRDAAPAAPPSLEEQRAFTAVLFAEMATEPDGVTYEQIDAGGVPAMWIVPDGAPEDRVLQYVHGGGYVIMSMHTHRRMVGHVAKAAGVRALSVDYRLAPEHPHPAAVDDSVTAYRWLLSQGFAPERLAIAGDSAGGGLTIATLVALRDQGVPLPAAAVPISPWVDLEGTGETMTTRAEVDLLINPRSTDSVGAGSLNGRA